MWLSNSSYLADQTYNFFQTTNDHEYQNLAFLQEIILMSVKTAAFIYECFLVELTL